MKKKEKKFNVFVALVRLVAALWLGFLFAIVPMYIFRGTYHDAATKATYENLILTVVSVVAAALCLILLYRADDEAARMDGRDALKAALIPTAIHVLLCALISWTKYPLILLGGVFPLAELLSPGAHNITEQPAWSWIVAALMVAPILAVAVYVGCLAARRKRQKELSHKS